MLFAPLDVQLDCDDRTMVQPDIVISCEKERRSKRGIYGAPDMVIEITSPSTRKRDFTKKDAEVYGCRSAGILDRGSAEASGDHLFF